MKVLHVITGLDTGGAEKMLHKLVAQHQKMHVESRVISLSKPGPVSEDLNKLGIPVINLNARSLKSVLKHILQVYRWFVEADVVQGWMYHGNLFSLLAVFFRPTIWNVRQSLSQYQNEKLSLKMVIRLGALLSFLPKAIIYNSELAQEQHEKFGYLRSRSRLIQNGFDLEAFSASEVGRAQVRNRLKIQDEDLVILNVGRWHRDKDQRTLILAALEMVKSHPAIFILAGRGVDFENPDLASLIPDGAKSHFRIVGEEKDVPSLLRGGDIYTSSSVAEAFSNSIGEAMCCALPCVVTDVGNSASLVADSRWVVPTGTPKALVEKWKNLIQMPKDQRLELGLKNRERMKLHYSVERVAEVYKDFYSKLM
jgi:glycosyltransferase involved in cell wall biosynthesis